jgi:drug/metabolite transporter (DMT)-like permease
MVLPPSTSSSLSAFLDRFGPVVAGVFVNIVFGGYSVVTAAALRGTTTSPIVYAFLRDVAAAVMLLTASYWATARARTKQQQQQQRDAAAAGAHVLSATPLVSDPSTRFWVDRADIGVFVGIGLLMVWGAQGMSALAIANLTASYFSLCSPLMPIVTLVVALATGHETLQARSLQSWAKILGLLTCVGGALVLGATSDSGAAGSPRSLSKNWALGNVYMALQLTLGGSFPVLQKTVLGKYSPMVTAAWGYAYGAALLGLSVLTCCMDAESWAITPGVLAALAYSSVLSSGVNVSGESNEREEAMFSAVAAAAAAAFTHPPTTHHAHSSITLPLPSPPPLLIPPSLTLPVRPHGLHQQAPRPGVPDDLCAPPGRVGRAAVLHLPRRAAHRRRARRRRRHPPRPRLRRLRPVRLRRRRGCEGIR